MITDDERYNAVTAGGVLPVKNWRNAYRQIKIQEPNRYDDGLFEPVVIFELLSLPVCVVWWLLRNDIGMLNPFYREGLLSVLNKCLTHGACKGMTDNGLQDGFDSGYFFDRFAQLTLLKMRLFVKMTVVQTALALSLLSPKAWKMIESLVRSMVVTLRRWQTSRNWRSIIGPNEWSPKIAKRDCQCWWKKWQSACLYVTLPSWRSPVTVTVSTYTGDGWSRWSSRNYCCPLHQNLVQLTMRTFRHGWGCLDTDITQGLLSPRSLWSPQSERGSGQYWS